MGVLHVSPCGDYGTFPMRERDFPYQALFPSPQTQFLSSLPPTLPIYNLSKLPIAGVHALIGQRGKTMRLEKPQSVLDKDGHHHTTQLSVSLQPTTKVLSDSSPKL